MAADTRSLVARLVNANWNDDNGGWNVYANDASNSNQWNDENQLFSGNCRMKPPAILREVCFSCP